MAEIRKFSPMRYTAATEEAAVQGALQIVGAARDEIEVEVIETSAKGVTVRIKPRAVQENAAPLPEAAESIAETSPIVEDVPELLAQDDASETGSENAPEIDEDAGQVEAQIQSPAADLIADAPEIAEETPIQREEIEAAPPAPVDPEAIARAQAKA